MLKTFLAAALFLALCFAALAIRILLKKGGRFPETEISRNKALRERGIRCVKEEEGFSKPSGRKASLSCGGDFSEACLGCGFYQSGHEKQGD